MIFYIYFFKLLFATKYKNCFSYIIPQYGTAHLARLKSIPVRCWCLTFIYRFFSSSFFFFFSFCFFNWSNGSDRLFAKSRLSFSIKLSLSLSLSHTHTHIHTHAQSPTHFVSFPDSFSLGTTHCQVEIVSCDECVPLMLHLLGPDTGLCTVFRLWAVMSVYL